MPSETYLLHLEQKRDKFIRDYELAIQGLKALKIGECTKFRVGLPEMEGHANTIVGNVIDIKDGKVIIELIAAEKMDYKMRKIISTRNRLLKKKTYPVALDYIRSTEPMKLREVPLLINYKYISEKFKNMYLR